MSKFLLITEAAIDALLITELFHVESFLPNINQTIRQEELSAEIVGYRAINESDSPYFALIKVSCLNQFRDNCAKPSDVYRRIARVVKGLKSPPVHLPRPWSEYHYKNLIAFFALPKEISNVRWVAELDGRSKCVKFDFLTSSSTEIELAKFVPLDWPQDLQRCMSDLLSVKIEHPQISELNALTTEVDLKAIGSSSVDAGRSYREWERLLTPSQETILKSDINARLRLVGPAGSGKTLALCMRALQISKDNDVVSQRKKVLISTHSWAMAERVDEILKTLNDGIFPVGVTVYPLLSLLEFHAGNIGNNRIEVIGDDSTDGRHKTIQILGRILESGIIKQDHSLSEWIREGLAGKGDSRSRLDLTINLYEEISGVVSASGVASDDPDSIQKYIGGTREEWMPPFTTVGDRGLVIRVYEAFIRELIDRSAITTDQFILDSIRVLETFSWRMRKETEGYDFILVDELQLFDPQERSALELLGRSRTGTPIISAEDPSQGVFAALNASPRDSKNPSVYLETVHRFDRGIFDLINFLYQKFPLNATSLKVSEKKAVNLVKPKIFLCDSDAQAIATTVRVAQEFFAAGEREERTCLATLGDVDAELVKLLRDGNVLVTELESFDDVERLAYSKRSVVVAPWQFVGGAQFANVIVVAVGVQSPTSQFARLRERISVYLACSRAAKSLTIICSGHIPADIQEAERLNLISRGQQA